MSDLDPSQVTELLYLEPDGELTRRQISQLEALAAASPEMARERRELARLHALLVESKIEVRAGFRSDVMASLPAAGWAARHPRTWWVAAAVLALLGGAAGLLAGLSAARLEPASPFVAALGALGDLLVSSLTAGAGLLGASWRGIGLALGDWLGQSVPNALAFGVVLAGVGVLLLRRLRRRARPAPAAVAAPSRTDGSAVE